MFLGAVWCPKWKVHRIAKKIRNIKVAHGLSTRFEIKWTKVSPGATAFYRDLVNFFFDEPDLHFRGLIAAGKDRLRHDEFDQSHDEWYYKMYFDLLKVILRPKDQYHIYVDIKDTRGGTKIDKLRDVLCSNMYDFERSILEDIQLVRSYESEILQLTDLILGAVTYANRDLQTSSTKLDLVQLIRSLSGYSLSRSTLLAEDKINLFRWSPRDIQK